MENIKEISDVAANLALVGCTKPVRVPTQCDVPKIKAVTDIYVRNANKKPSAHDLQAAELNSLGISEDVKKLIAAEFERLRNLHPKWKPSKTARKAGEKYNVKFMFE